MELYFFLFVLKIFIAYFSFGLVIESTVGWVYSIMRRINRTRVVLAILVGNCITYPLAFAYAFVFGLTDVEYIFIEFVVALVEAGVIWHIGKTKCIDAIVISILANTLSALGPWILKNHNLVILIM